mmetsp:Transcript_30524/g.50400  ORF Transcript_30524/g.50400 Transcript_30524/m.50400 type:complete len:443 (+) Transcript_30524:29-1357(+)
MHQLLQKQQQPWKRWMQFFLVGIVLMAAGVLVSISSDGAWTNDHNMIARRVQKVQNGESTFMEGIDDLRIAAFGSSVTSGSGLENPKEEAYPHLVSKFVDNYGMHSGSPNYPAVCTETLVGEFKIYDVIILEYWLMAQQGLKDLAFKIRDRYSNAIILLVKIMGPAHARRKESPLSRSHVTFPQWRDANGLKGAATNDIIDAINADTGFWFFPKRPGVERYIKGIRNNIGAHRVSLPHMKTDKETLIMRFQMFDRDHTKLNSMGHAMLANMTTGTIENTLKFASPHELIANEKLGTWGRGDKCQFWASVEDYTVEHSESIEVKKWRQLSTLDISGSGNLTFSNPFANGRHLYVTFLTSKNEFTPPKIQTRIGSLGKKHELQPSYGIPNHNVRTVSIGKIHPGRHTISVSVLEKTGSPFRILGLTLTDENALPSEFGFMPPFK